MQNKLLLALFSVLSLQYLNAQHYSNTIKDKFIKESIYSTKYYKGNSFKEEFLITRKNHDLNYIRRGIYLSNKQEKTSNEIEINSSKVVSYNAYISFQFGGEAKLTFMPKFGFTRQHNNKSIKPYYGLEGGLYHLLMYNTYTLNMVLGAKKNIFSLESNVNNFWVPSHKPDAKVRSYRQSSLGIKAGIDIKKTRLKTIIAFIIDENIPQGEDSMPLFGIGRINNVILGVELSVFMISKHF